MSRFFTPVRHARYSIEQGHPRFFGIFFTDHIIHYKSRKIKYFLCFLLYVISYNRLSVKTARKFSRHLLVTGLAEQGEHVLFVRLNTGLVKGIDTKQITRKCAGKLKEVDHIA